MAETLKQLARHYSGRYVPKYKNWIFPSWAKSFLQQELEALADSGQLMSGAH